MGNTTGPEFEQLAAEFVDRLRRGDDVDAEEYVRLHPAHAEQIEELFPVLAVMEALKPGATAAEIATGADDPAGFSQIGPYHVVRELGRGGMGRVFEAVGPGGRRVAVKVIHSHLVDRPGYLVRFLREVEAGTRIDHPGVVKTLESGTADIDGAENPYLVLEFIEGQNLRELLDEISPLSERLCRVIGERVADALGAIHAQGMVHRDIKPENVVITADETVKVMDLGVALLLEEQVRLSGSGEFVGSLLYAAPEQLRSGDIGPGSDLYALGLLLFELMTGTHPRMVGRGTSIPSFDDTTVSLREHAPQASAFLDTLVRTLLTTDPNARPISAEAVARVLREGEQDAWWQAQEQARDAAPSARWRMSTDRCFGRERELTRLDRALGSVAREGGRVLVVEGEEGIGKSHLVATWLSRLEQQSSMPTVLFVEHTEGVGASTTTMLAGALVEQMGAADLEARVRDVLGGTQGYVDAVVAHLRGEHTAAPLSVEACEVAYLRLMAALARDHGLIVVVEDLDRASESWVQSFLRLGHGIGAHPILLLANVRAPAARVHAGVREIPRAEVLELGPLDTEAAFTLVRTTVTGLSATASGIRELVVCAGGNPYYLLELARELARTTAGGELPDPRVAAAETLPETLDALVEARLAKLPPDVHELLSAAACAGDLIDPGVVLSAAGIPKLRGLRMLHALDREHGVLVPVGDRYRFRQRLAKSKLHAGLPPKLRAAYHTEYGVVLEARLPAAAPAPGAQAYAITRHFLLGDDPMRAVPYARVALQHIVGQYEFQRASDMASRLLELGDALPPDVHAHVAFVKGTCLVAHAAPRDALPFFKRALGLAEESGDLRLSVQVLVQLLDCEREGGEIESALKRAQVAIERVEQLDDLRVATEVYGQYARLLRDTGKLDEARAVAQRGLEIAAKSQESLPVGVLSFYSGAFELEAGNIDAGRLLLDRAVSIAHMHGERSLESGALSALANIAYVQCRLGETLDLLTSVLELARELGQTRIETVTAMNLAQIVPHMGDYPTAVAHAERGRSVAEALGYGEIHARSVLALGTIRFLQGRYGDALTLLEQAGTALAEIPTPVVRSRHAVVLANVLMAMGRFEASSAELQRGVAAAEEAHAASELESARWGQGVQLAAEGRRDEAVACLAAVADRIRSTGTLLHGTTSDARLGELLVEVGDTDRARELLEGALERAEPGGLRGVAALCRVWLELLPDGNPLTARIEIEQHADAMPADARLRALVALAARTGDPTLHEQARLEAEALIASAPESCRETMRGVSLVRAALAPTR